MTKLRIKTPVAGVTASAPDDAAARKREKIRRRMARLAEDPATGLSQAARDIGFAIARGDRDLVDFIARELARSAPERSPVAPAAKGEPDDGGDHAPDRGDDREPDNDYWAGFAAGLGTMLAAFAAAHDRVDARAAALELVRSRLARAVILALGKGPATGAELAARAGSTPGAISKQLTALRVGGLVRMLSGEYPRRGARKPHVLTPLGTWVAERLRADEDAQSVADAG